MPMNRQVTRPSLQSQKHIGNERASRTGDSLGIDAAPEKVGRPISVLFTAVQFSHL